MSWQDYQIGRRVACIQQQDGWSVHCDVWPRLGKVYTIRATSMGLVLQGEETLGLRFREFESFSRTDLQPRDGFWWFPAVAFRPLDERRLDQFRKLLINLPAAVSA